MWLCLLLEAFEKRSIFPKVKKDEDLNRRNTLSILRLKSESDAEIGEKREFFKDLT